jgi:hypothetical protein
LPDWPARRDELAENYRRAVSGASRRAAGAQIPASPDLNCRRRGFEVGFEHRLYQFLLLSLTSSLAYHFGVN